MAGSLGGQIIGALVYDSLVVGYLFFAAFALVMLSVFILVNPDRPSVDLPREPFRLTDFLHTFWVNPLEHPDFFWAFTGRLLLYTGYFTVTGYQLYILTDYLGVAEPQTIIPLLGVISLAGILLSTALSGPLSDRIGRRKPFVFGSSIVLGLSLLIPWTWPTLEGWFVFTALAGLGFGMFQAVDTALISQVLPSAKSYGKDLGAFAIWPIRSTR